MAARAEFILMDKSIHLMNLGSAVEKNIGPNIEQNEWGKRFIFFYRENPYPRFINLLIKLIKKKTFIVYCLF